ncbi:MAG: histidine phosphatase family protein [Cyclobacteriaceae bacterium]
MSKQLFLIRHAQAEPTTFDSRDKDRILTDMGCQDAMRMGKCLHENNVLPDHILSSTAERTQQTTRYICEQIGFDFEKVEFLEDLYESSLRLVLQTINNASDSYNSIFVVGHNPSISYLGEYLCDEVLGGVPPGTVIHLNTSATQWAELSKGTCDLQKLYDPMEL